MTPPLCTERLYLRNVVPQDQLKVFEGLSHPEVIKHYGVSYATFEATAAQMEWYQTQQDNRSGYFWVLEQATSGQFMGIAGIYFINWQHRSGELGYWLLPEFWNQGYATEALDAILKHMQTEVKLHRIAAEIETANTTSVQLLKRIGFSYEGTKVDVEIKDGKYISLSLWAKIFPEN